MKRKRVEVREGVERRRSSTVSGGMIGGGRVERKQFSAVQCRAEVRRGKEEGK